MTVQDTAPGLSPHIARLLAERGDRIVVTGASGWLGMATLELLADALGDDFDARVRCFGTCRRVLVLRSGRQVVQARLVDLAALDHRPTIVLHFAFLTRDRAETMADVNYIAANRDIADTVLAALDPIGARAVFLASSGAARRADDTTAARALRLYGTLKRDDERRFSAWAEQSGHAAIIARIFNLSGPYINKPQHYALAGFIANALAGHPIEIRATHSVERGYVAIRELMSLAFSLALDKTAGVVAFDTGGAPMELAEVARHVTAIVGDVPITRAPSDGSASDSYLGGAEIYDRSIADHGIEPVDFPCQVAETAQYLRFSASPTQELAA